MVDNLSSPIGGANREVSNFEQTLQKLNTGFVNLAKSGLVMVEVGNKIMGFASQPVQAVFETKEALGELSSVGITNLEALEKAGEQFSNTWAGTTKAEFIKSAYDIKSGISSLSDEAVAQYTEIAGITAKGTKASVDEMTSLFATGYGIYKDYYSDLSDLEFAEMFSAGIASSVQQFKTDGSQMAQSLQTLGGTATSANVPLEEQLSILGMLQATMSGSEASTKYKAFLQNAVKAGDDLGLSFTDANNQLLTMPEILEQLHNKFGDTIDAGEKLQLQKAFGSAEAVALIDLLYNKTDDLQGNIVNMYGSLGQGVDVATEMANAINSTEGNQYEVLQQRLHNIVETIGNGMLPTVNELLGKANDVLTVVGNWISENEELAGNIMLLIGGFGALVTTLGAGQIAVSLLGLAITKPIQGFMQLRNVFMGIPSALDTIALKGMYAKDTLVGGFGKIKSASGTALGGIKKFGTGMFNLGKQAVTTSITFTKNLVKSIITTGKQMIITSAGAVKNFGLSLISMGKQAITTAMTSLPPLIASVWSFTAALLANPVTWIIIGIIALVGALYLLWKNWDTVVAWLNGAWNSCVNFVVNAFQWIKDKISEVPTSVLALIAVFAPFLGIPLLIIQNWEVIKEFFSGLWTNISTGFSNFFTGFLPSLLESGKKIMMTLADGIVAGVMYPVDAVKNGFAKVRNLLPFSDAKEGPLSTLTLSGSKIMSTLADGIVSGAMAPVDAVKNGFTKLRQLLPFSDAKEGPLSTLTLSGSKIFSTIGEGMELTKNIPSDLTNKAFDEINLDDLNEKAKSELITSKNTEKSINLKETFSSDATEKEVVQSEKSGASISIGNIHLNFDIKSLEDIKFIKLLVDELKDLQNQTDDEEVVTA